MLPFKTSPTQETKLVGIGKRTGVLEFPVFCSLLVIEQININKFLRELSPYVLACELAVKIEAEREIDLLLCYDAIVGKFSDAKDEQDLLQMQRIRILYAREIAKINNFSEDSADEERLITVTEVMTRIVPEWSLEKTYKIPKLLFEEIWQFAQSEITGGGIQNGVEPTREDIKKPQDESPSLLIGEASSGESEVTGLMTGDLTTITLESSPVN